MLLALLLMLSDARQESVMSSLVSTRKRKRASTRALQELLFFTWIVFSGSSQVILAFCFAVSGS